MSRRFATWLFVTAFFVLLLAGVVNLSGTDLNLKKPVTYDHEGVNYVGRTIQSGESSSWVAVVPVHGVIVNGDSSPDGSFVGGEDLVRTIEAVTEAKYDGIVLEVNSPGGAVLASDEIAEAIRNAQKHDVKVVSWMRDFAASGGYYISAPADRIVAAPTTITGSIGIILQYFNVEGLTDKVGVEPVTIKSGPMKDIVSPFDELTADERALLQAIINEAFDRFVDVVAEGRDMEAAAVRKLADGRIYTGEQALDLGLVDELGTRDDAYDAMARLLDVDDGADLGVVQVTRRYGFWDSVYAASAAGRSPSTSQLLWLVGAALRGDTAAPAAAGPASNTGVGGMTAPAYVDDGLPRLEYRAVL